MLVGGEGVRQGDVAPRGLRGKAHLRGHVLSTGAEPPRFRGKIAVNPRRGQPPSIVALNAHAFGEIAGCSDATRHVSNVVFGPSNGGVHVPAIGLRVRPKVVRPSAVKVHGVHGWHGASRTGKHGQVNADLVVHVRVQQTEVDQRTGSVVVGRNGHAVPVKDGPEQFRSSWKVGFDGHVRPAAFLDVADATTPADGGRGPL